jgi:hypothetical protein
MLIPCVECGKREYTQESPLWFHCDRCLHPKKEKLYKCCICLEDYKLGDSDFVNYCKKCGKMYRDQMILMKVMKNKDCPICYTEMDYFMLSGSYDHYECGSCGFKEDVS